MYRLKFFNILRDFGSFGILLDQGRSKNKILSDDMRNEKNEWGFLIENRKIY